MHANFHLSLPCFDLEKTKQFYLDVLGLPAGRSTSKWLDVNLFNHQVTFVTSEKFEFKTQNYLLEGNVLPLFHFGIILDETTWNAMYHKINHWTEGTTNKKTFLKDKKGAHQSFFVKDPNNYTVEFKTFVEKDSIFLV